MGDNWTTSAIRKIALFAAAATAAGLVIAPAQAQARSTHEARTSAIVSWDGGHRSLDALGREVTAGGGHVVRPLPVAGALLLDVPAHWAPPAGVLVSADRPLTVAATSYAPASDEPTVRATLGVTAADDGAGVTVALVDTGVADVADLAGSVEHVNVSGAAQGDGFGHGTFLAGVIAAHGNSTDAPVRGIAPAARILDVQVADAAGNTSLVQVIDGLEAVSRRAAVDPTLRVVNLSLSSPMDLPFFMDPLARSLEALWEQGLVVVVAAGNEGGHRNGVTSPASDPVVLSVGALDESRTAAHRDDAIAAFSSSGRSFGADKPEVVAPGVSIVGLRAPGSLIDREHPEGRVGVEHFRGSGTSMAAAVTAGLAADLIAGQSSLAPDDVKAALTDGAYDVNGRRTHGARAIFLPGAADAATVSGADTDTPQVHDAWADFAAAWSAGSYDDGTVAWAKLPHSLQQRAAWAWATAVATDERATPEQVAQARQWAADVADGTGNSNGSVGWLARAWSSSTWTARAWSARAWSARAWSARAWSVDLWGPASP